MMKQQYRVSFFMVWSVLAVVSASEAQSSIEPTIGLQIKAFDKAGQFALSGVRIEITYKGSDLWASQSDSTGAFDLSKDLPALVLEPDVRYAIVARKEGYLTLRDTIDTQGLKESTLFRKEYYLQGIFRCN
jgi:hypothetical protein